MRSDGFFGLVVTESRKLLTTLGSRVVLIVIAGLGVAVGGIAGVFAVEDDLIGASAVLVGLNGVLALAMPILGVMVLASDWQTRDTCGIFLAQPRRSPVFFSKLTAVVVTAAALIVACAALALLLASILALITGRPLEWSGISDAVPLLVGATFAGALMGAAAGAAILNVAVGITACFVATLVLDPLLGLVHAVWVDYVAPGSIVQYLTGSGGVGPFLTATALWMLLPLGVGFWRNRTREVG